MRSVYISCGCSILLLLIVVIFALVSNTIGQIIIDTIVWVGTGTSVWSFLFYIIGQFAYAWLMIPWSTAYIIAMTYFMDNLIAAFLVALIGGWAAAMSVFVIDRYFIHDYMERKLEKNLMYVVIKEQAEHRPLATSFVIHFLFFPMAFKNHLVPLTKIKFWQYLIPSVIFYVLYSFVLCMIGNGISQVEEITSRKGFSDSSLVEQIFLIFVVFLVVFTLLVMCVLAYLGKKRFRVLKEEKVKEEKLRLKKILKLKIYKKILEEKTDL